MKVSELKGVALDWAVFQALSKKNPTRTKPLVQRSYSSDWAAGGPIIDEEMLSIAPAKFSGYEAQPYPETFTVWCDTPLQAAMRCFVISKLGEEVFPPAFDQVSLVEMIAA